MAFTILRADKEAENNSLLRRTDIRRRTDSGKIIFGFASNPVPSGKTPGEFPRTTDAPRPFTAWARCFLLRKRGGDAAFLKKSLAKDFD